MRFCSVGCNVAAVMECAEYVGGRMLAAYIWSAAIVVLLSEECLCRCSQASNHPVQKLRLVQLHRTNQNVPGSSSSLGGVHACLLRKRAPARPYRGYFLPWAPAGGAAMPQRCLLVGGCTPTLTGRVQLHVDCGCMACLWNVVNQMERVGCARPWVASWYCAVAVSKWGEGTFVFDHI